MGRMKQQNKKMMISMLLFVLSVLLKSCATVERPHIVFIVADDLGWNDVSYHGSKQIPTPNIDAFALDGIILNKYYVAPTCTPSRGSLMTGKYAIRLGLQHVVIEVASPEGLPLREKILPEYLNELGYVSHGVGKWHLGFYRNEYLPTRRGFKSFFGYWSGKEDYYTHFATSSQDGYIGLDFHDGEENAWDYIGQYATDIFTQKTKDIIMNHNTSQPLFLFVSHQAVHSGNDLDPLQVPEKYVRKFPYIKDEVRRRFAGIVSSLDDSFGHIVEALDDKGMLDNTLLIFSSDNGAAVRGTDGTSGSNWPLRGSKYTLWEGGVKAAAWIWSADLRKKRHVNNGLFHISDWLPTIYTAVGGNSKEMKNLDGVDQWLNIQGLRNSTREELLLNIDQVSEVESLIKWPFKLISGTTDDGLYDGWYDQEGKFIEEFSTEDLFTREEEEMFTKEYELQLQNSKCREILLKKYEEDVQKLRRNNRRRLNRLEECKMVSTNRVSDCRPQDAPCLFNVEKDPCEFNNIASIMPQVVRELQAKLQRYRKESVPPMDYPSDPAANPKLHQNAWVPWKSVEDGMNDLYF